MSFVSPLFRRAARRAAQGALLATACAAIGGALPTAASAAINVTSFDTSLTDNAGNSVRQAGAHPNVNVSFRLETTNPANPLETSVIEQMHRTFVKLPPGLVGDATQIPTCSDSQMKAASNGNAAVCPVNSQIGYALISQGSLYIGAPIYNLGGGGQHPAVFGFTFLGAVIRLVPTVRAGDYGITMDSGTISQAAKIPGVDVVLWGVPQDPANNAKRVAPGTQLSCLTLTVCLPTAGGQVNTDPPAPLTSLPTRCDADPLRFDLAVDGWRSQGQFTELTTTEDVNDVPFTLTGCDRLPFEVDTDVRATSRVTDSPSGLEVDLSVAQNRDPNGVAAAHVKDVAMALPDGMSVSPGSAAGLGACSPAEIDLASDAAPNCPRSSKLGTVTIETPLLDEPLKGDVLLATPDQNPFGSLVALYIVAEGSGVRVKLPGRVDPNPVTGQLTATFMNNPQLPFSALRVRLDGGPNGSLATPTKCGRYETQVVVTSWSGKKVGMTSPMTIDQNCSTGGFAPAVSAGSEKPFAAKDSAFVLNLDRPDGQQNYGSVGVEMPPGLLARIGDIQLCGEADAAAGSCNDNSLIGQVTTTAGPGSAPLPVRGKAYLTGPYKGGPYGISIVVPTAGQAGPFDLGNVVVRARINVDRKDAHVTVTSDPMPTILRGFPLRIRQVQVAINHGRFMLNPSSCEPMHVGVWVHGTGGGVHESQVPYRMSGCGDLEQDQKISIGFTNKTQQRPGKHPGVEAKLTSKGPGVANLKKVVVKLPLSVALDPQNAKALCKPEQREAKACPKDSIVGDASAKSVLKDELKGPIYFVEGTRTTKQGRVVPTLPKLWIPLSGGGVTIDVNADSHVSQRKLVSTFKDLPDAPITEFKLRLNSGKNGILTVPPSKEGGTCQRDRAVDMQLTGQNGAVKTVRSNVKVAGCKTKKSSKKSSAKASAKRGVSKAFASRR